jgi:hypothetical protein
VRNDQGSCLVVELDDTHHQVFCVGSLYNNKRSFGQSSVRINGGLQFYFIIVQVEAAVAVRQTEAPSHSNMK